MKLKLLYQDTRTNDEYFALTPYIACFGIKEYMTYGVSICWGYYNIGIAITNCNNLKKYPFFIKFTKKQKKK